MAGEKEITPDEELEEIEEQEETQEEVLDDDDEQVEDQEVPEEDESDEAPEEEAVEDDGLPFDEWIGQYELPDIPKDPEELVQRHKQLLAEREELRKMAELAKWADDEIKRAGYGGLEAIRSNPNLPPPVQPRQQQLSSEQTGRLFDEVLKQSIQNGEISEDDVSYMRPFGPVFNRIFGALANGLNQVYEQTTQGITGVKSQFDEFRSDNQAWNEFTRDNPGVNVTHDQRGKLRDTMKSHNFNSYAEALLWHQATDPSFIKDTVAKIKKTEEAKAYRKLKGSFSLSKTNRSGATKTRGFNPKEYFDPSGDLDGDKLIEDVQSKRITEKQYKVVLREAGLE